MLDKTNQLTKRIVEYINKSMPITASNGMKLDITNVKVNIPESNFDVENQLRMKYTKDSNTEGYISGTVKITSPTGKKLYSGTYNRLIVFPVATDRGTYIVNGVEKSIISQMKMKSGCYTNFSSNGSIKTQLRFDRNIKSGAYMPAMNLILDPVSREFYVTVDSFKKKVKFNILTFLTMLGFTESEIRQCMGTSSLAEAVMVANSKKKSVQNIDSLYKLFMPRSIDGVNLNDAQKRKKLYDFFNENAKFGDGEVIKSTLGVTNGLSLNKEVITRAVKKTMSVAAKLVPEDVKDEIKYKEILNDNDLIFNAVASGLDKFVDSVQAKMENHTDDTRTALILTGAKDYLNQNIHGSNGLMRSELCIASEETNPLFMEAKSREITQGGPDGTSKDAMRNELMARNLTESGINKIDPIETPESGKIGVTQHITTNAIIENGTIKSEFYPVKNKSADINSINKVRLSPLEEENSVIAFNDSEYVEVKNGKYVFTQDIVPARYMGKESLFPINKVQYIDASRQSLLGTTTNMIPFVGHDDGSRALMGAAMQKQAIDLVKKEAPIVTTLVDHESKTTFDEKVGEEFGKPVRSTVDGIVKSINKSKIVVVDTNGQEHNHEYHYYYPLNQSFINNELKVKVGQPVKQGQILAEGWQTDNGKLAIGINARIGYIPFKGYNYEDGVVVSESFAQRMTSNEYTEKEVLIPKGAQGGRGSNIKSELLKETTNAGLRLFDNDGIIKEGSQVKAGSLLVGYLKEIQDDSDDVLDLLIPGAKNKPKYKYKAESIASNSYVAGKIVRITVIDNPDSLNKQKIIFGIQNAKPLKVGDKIAGRHGNKGEITLILPDKLMPVAQDGKSLDIAMSPLAIPSRKNLGQVLECGAGLLAEKTGKRFVVDNFNHNERQRVLDGLKAIGYPGGKMKVTLKEERDGKIIDVPVENPVTVGTSYIMKLKHKADDKIQARSNYETFLSAKTFMPAKVTGTAQGEKNNPQRLGEMEFRALEGHGASWNILEASTIKADGGGDAITRKALYKAITTGKLDGSDLSRSATPETVRAFCDTLKGLGQQVTPMYNGRAVSFDKPFNSIGIAPLNQKEFIETIGKDKEVFKSSLLQARQFYDEDKPSKNKKARPEFDNGLLDKNIFGDGTNVEDRNKWGYIKLPMPVPNPLYMEDRSNNIYSILTGVKSQDLKDLSAPATMTGKTAKAIITNIADLEPAFKDLDEDLVKMYKEKITNDMKALNLKEGSIISISELDKLKEQGITLPCRTGGDALSFMLKKVDVDKELEKAQLELSSAKKGPQIQSAYKRVRSLQMLKNNNLKAEDLMVKYVPVLPAYLRPVLPNKATNTLFINDTNKIYGKIIDAKQYAEKGAVLDDDGNIQPVGLNELDIAQRSKIVYESLKILNGSKQVKEKGSAWKSLPETLSSKEGLIRKEMLAKREDFSGRTVITVDPNLGLNEAGVPLDMAKKLYEPFIKKALVDRGVCTEKDVKARLANPDVEVKRVIQAVAKDRPLLFNRQPSLHKLSIQAMTPIIKEYENGGVVRSIQLNPLVVTGFNADFDGDQMAAHVPVTEKAKEEAKEILMPSNNLVNPTDGKMIISIRHEMALGLYQITKHFDKMTGTAKKYDTYKQLEEDYLLGKIPYSQRVKTPVSMQDTTAGQALFNWCIPDKVKKYRNFRQVWDSKKISKLMMDIYKEADDSNFKLISKLEISEIFNRLKNLGFKTSTRAGVSLGLDDFTFDDKITKDINTILNKGQKNGVIDPTAWKKVEDEIEDKLQKGLLPEDNPLQVMMSSGARANAQQIRKMFATIGLGMDVTKTMIDPIKNSLYQGLSPQEYYKLGKDSRKGIYDRSVSTEAPGALTREVWAATQDVVVTEKDCGTKEFINIVKSDKTIVGRYAGKDIYSKKKTLICRRNQIITNAIYEKIYKDDTIQYVPVRSVLRCKTPNGKCQMCYGASAQTVQPVPIGTAIGVLASQAIGEPVTQMTMNTFHTGGANSQATLGLPRVESILNLSQKPKDQAALANVSGVVTDIIETPSETQIMIGKSKHVIKKVPGSPSLTLRVKKGDIVRKGEFLTVGSSADIVVEMNKDKGETKIILSNASPKKLFELNRDSVGQQKALDITRDYLTNTMQYAVQASNAYMDRRHAEVMSAKLTGTAMVIDSGDSPYMKGQKGDVNLFERWNQDNCTGTKTKDMSTSIPANLVGRRLAQPIKIKGKMLAQGIVIDNAIASSLASVAKNVKVSYKPIEYSVMPQGKTGSSLDPENSWFGSLGSEKVKQGIVAGSVLGAVDNLKDPRSRLMTGKMMDIGTTAKYNDDLKTRYTNRMANFFSKKINFDKYKK